MNNFKKFASILLALILVLAMAVPAMAATDTTITVPAGNTRSYDVYQIFRGDYFGGVLSNVVWGKNGKGTEGTAVPDGTLKDLAAVNSAATNEEKLTEIKKYVTIDENSRFGTVTSGSPLTAPTGYYLIVDKGPVGDGEAYSLYVVQVVGPTTISPKTGTTTSQKKVMDDDAATNDWQDSADYDIGDMVPFQLKATIAADYDNYTKGYKLTFHDTHDECLVFDSNTVVVKVDGSPILEGFTVVTNPTHEGCSFEVVFGNLKDIASVKAGSVITVEYNCELTAANVKYGNPGNKNTMHITYTNNPNDEQAGQNGKTPDDTVVVFTYKTVVNKTQLNPAYNAANDKDNDGVDDTDNTIKKFIPLTGAGFTLYKKDAEGAYSINLGELKAAAEGETMTTFTWNGLDAGNYKIEETQVPGGFNKAPDIEFTVTAEHEILADVPVLTSLSGGSVMTGDVATGTVTTDVENKAGTQLPSTGGIGTTIFYVVGSILLVGAAVILIAKRRMGAEK